MIFAKLAMFAGAVIASASAADYNPTLYEKSTFAGTELMPGDYKLQVTGETAKIFNKKTECGEQGQNGKWRRKVRHYRRYSH